MKKNNSQSLVLALAVIVMAAGVSIFFVRGAGAEVKDGRLILSGIYGETVPLAQIEEVRLLDDFPRFGVKTNGINLGFVNLGIFQYPDFGRVRLFELNHEKPYLLVKTAKESIVIALGKEKNSDLYRLLMNGKGR